MSQDEEIVIYERISYAYGTLLEVPNLLSNKEGPH